MSSEYLSWVEQTRLKIEEGVRAVDKGAVLAADEVITRLRRKVADAKSADVFSE